MTNASDNPPLTGLDTLVLARLRAAAPIVTTGVYLDHAALGPLTRSALEALDEYHSLVTSRGSRALKELARRAEETRAASASLIGARDADQIAFLANTTDGISTVAEGLDWRPGDNVVGFDDEYPANLLPWMHLRRYGVEFRRVSRTFSGSQDVDALLTAVDDRTRVITVSLVHFASGASIDVERLSKFCRNQDALLVVDGAQGVGCLALDVASTGIDVLAAGVSKWLLSPHGLALLYLSERAIDLIRPTRTGVRSVTGNTRGVLQQLPAFATTAHKFESGTLNLSAICALAGSLRFFKNLDRLTMERRVVGLAQRLSTQLESLGFRLAVSPSAVRSGIVAAAHDCIPSDELAGALGEHGITVSVRRGHLRLSPHVYNTEEEIDTVHDVTQALLETCAA